MQVRRRNAGIIIHHVGDAGVPPLNTLDPDILVFCEREHCILVTRNRHSMPRHVTDLYQAGGRPWGILKVRRGRERDMGGIVEALVLIWELEEADNYLDREEWIPF